MRTILTLVSKDLRRRLADPAGVLLSIAIPLAITATMALSFGGRGGGEEDHPKLRAVVADLDGTPFSSILSGASRNSEANKHLDIKLVTSREEGLAVMQDEDYAALLVIPKGFAEAVLNGRQTRLELVKNPAQRIMPIAVEQSAEIGAVYLSTFSRFLKPEDLATLRGLFEGEGWDDSLRIAALLTSAYDRIQDADELLFPPLITVKTRKEAGDTRGGFDLTGWMFPGMIVMGLLFVALNQMKDMLRERAAGTLKRQLAAPLSPAALMVSKVIAAGLVVGVAHLLMLGSGSLFFGLSWGPLIPLLAASMLLVFAVTGFVSIIYAVARTENQGDALGSILIMIMSLLGGAFIPAQLLPSFLRNLSKITLNHWGNETFRTLAGGGGWAGISTYLLVLAAMGLVFTSIGMAAMSRRLTRGVA